jgi:predicted HD phosphohydrolase
LLEILKEKKLALILQQDYLEKVGSNKSARMFNKKRNHGTEIKLVAKSFSCPVLIIRLAHHRFIRMANPAYFLKFLKFAITHLSKKTISVAEQM